jgi:hypothetical protein
MAWNSLTLDDVDMTPDEKAIMDNLSGNTSQLQNILSRTVAATRGSIIGGGNRLGPDGTIPDQLRQEVIDIIRWQWINAFPQLRSLASESRQKLHDDARATINSVAKGQIRVEVPPTSISAVAPGNAAQVLRPGRNPNAASFDLTAST